jgi:hypothetical protein
MRHPSRRSIFIATASLLAASLGVPVLAGDIGAGKAAESVAGTKPAKSAPASAVQQGKASPRGADAARGAAQQGKAGAGGSDKAYGDLPWTARPEKARQPDSGASGQGRTAPQAGAPAQPKTGTTGPSRKGATHPAGAVGAPVRE